MTTIQKNQEVATSPKERVSSGLSDIAKKRINFGFNGVAAGINLATAISGNISEENPIHEGLEILSSFSMRCATAAQGCVEATIAYEKKNLISFIGGLLELPISIMAPWFNFFLHRGPAIGTNLYEGVIDSLNVEENGKKTRYEDFKKEGWLKGAQIMIKQVPKLIKEIFTKPLEKEGFFPRWSFLFSSGMILGPILHYFGLSAGAPIRDFAGGAEALALMTHSHNSASQNTTNDKESKTKEKENVMFSNYFWSGVVWTAGAITDYVKRLPRLEDVIKNWTEVSLSLDRLGSIFYILGNQGTDKKTETSN